MTRWAPPLAAALLASACARGGDVPPAAAPRTPAHVAEVEGEPVRLLDPAAAGLDTVALERIDSILSAAVADGASPGAALALGRTAGVVRLRGYGRLDYDAGSPAVTDSTIYDLASLTKVVVTTTAAMLLVEDGRFDLDAPLARYLPGWGGSPEKERVTIRDLLTHSAGLTGWAPLWTELRGRDAFVERIVEMPLSYAPGQKTVYSDLDFILLGAALEAAAGESLDVLLRERVFEPLGLRETGFNPLGGCLDAAEAGGWAPPSRIAPTEVDTIFRDEHVRGVVHDENACAMGGVAPHAGLFSSARDLARFARMLLAGGRLDGVRILDASTIDRFARRQSESSSRALGWDTPSEGSSAGALLSRSAFGHTGFTGTSLWIDPELDLFVVLLTNRVNPTRENAKHIPLRRAVHEAAARAAIDGR